MSHRPSIKKIRANSNALGLTAILAVGLVIQVVRFVRLGPQLAAVSASTGPNAGGAASAAPSRDLLVTLAAADMDESRQLIAHTEQVVQALKAYPTTRPAESRALPSNPFRSGEVAGHVKDQAEQERADTLAAAQALTLQSVMKSEVAPVCMVNNMLLREQQQVNGFTVDQIKSDAVIVHRGPYRFELRMLHEH